MRSEIDWHKYRPQVAMGVSLEGSRAVRIFPTAKVDIDQIPQSERHVVLWRKDGSAALSKKVFVKSIEQERDPAISGDSFLSSTGLKIDIWTDRKQEKVFHFHEMLSPRFFHPDRQTLRTFLEVYDSNVGVADTLLPFASFCPNKGLEFGPQGEPKFILKPDGDTCLLKVPPECKILQDGTWQGDPKYPFRLSYDSPPYFFEEVIMTGSITSPDSPPVSLNVISGLYLSSLSTHRMGAGIADIIRSGTIDERMLREVFSPYLRLDTLKAV